MTGSRLAALLDQATPGPWRYGYEDGSGKVEKNWPESGGAVVAADDTIVRSGRDDWGVPFGVEREADARLIALAPDMARLLMDMAEALNSPWLCSPDCLAFQGYGHHVTCVDRRPELLARFAALDEKAGAARGCAACDGDPEAHGLHVCGKEFGA